MCRREASSIIFALMTLRFFNRPQQAWVATTQHGFLGPGLGIIGVVLQVRRGAPAQDFLGLFSILFVCFEFLFWTTFFPQHREAANDKWVRVPPPTQIFPASILFYFDGELLF